MHRVFAILAVLACCVLAVGPASADKRKTPRGLWATINICDTPNNDNMIGIRASIPGDGQHSRMYMRFSDQYYSPSKQQWVTIQRTRWYFVGSGIYARRESGRTFQVQLSPGQSYTIRGLVDYRWTLHGHTIRRWQLVTRRGHHHTLDADPPGYSASICRVS